MTDNIDEVHFWNEQVGPLWVASEDEIDRLTRPFGQAALTVASPAEGERVLDVGCGCGSSSRALAAAVGTAGEVVGVDVSEVMLVRARERMMSEGYGNMVFQCVDAQSARFEPHGFDLVFSQFGVMFFDDPKVAFANLRAGLRPGGRMVFVCWQLPAANPWMALPARAAMRFFELEAPPHEAPGPFSLASCDRIVTVLEVAGFTEIDITGEERLLQLGVDQSVEDWVHQRLLMGLGARRYEDSSPQVQAQARQAILESVRPYRVAKTLEMPAAAWVVIASTSR